MLSCQIRSRHLAVSQAGACLLCWHLYSAFLRMIWRFSEDRRDFFINLSTMTHKLSRPTCCFSSTHLSFQNPTPLSSFTYCSLSFPPSLPSTYFSWLHATLCATTGSIYTESRLSWRHRRTRKRYPGAQPIQTQCGECTASLHQIFNSPDIYFF